MSKHHEEELSSAPRLINSLFIPQQKSDYNSDVLKYYDCFSDQEKLDYLQGKQIPIVAIKYRNVKIYFQEKKSILER